MCTTTSFGLPQRRHPASHVRRKSTAAVGSSAMSEIAELDSVDWRILDELQNNATLPNRVLAERVGLAASSCLQRVRRLRERGVITGSHIDIDPAALGYHLEAVVAI